ncbi:hypothetical protein GC175_19140 [bacterium]|nr:hypothetical protein [bacterium]
MRKRTKQSSQAIWLTLLTLALVLVTVDSAAAHQPIFEEVDLTAESARNIADPTVSTALYATLGNADDVDFFTFTGKAGARILIGMTIPQIAGQEDFAPTVALIGPGLPEKDSTLLPESAESLLNADDGFTILEAPEDASVFFEPFSRTSYWRRQQVRVALPADGHYTLIVWHSSAQVGRYVLVVGDREIPGGDPLFAIKLPNYWTPVVADGAEGDSAAKGEIPAQLATCNVLQELRYRIFGGDLPCRPRGMP